MAGSIEVTLSETSKALCNCLLRELVKPSDFFKSEQMAYIKGDVTDEGHITLYYGFTPEVQYEDVLNFDYQPCWLNVVGYDIWRKDNYDILVMIVDSRPIQDLISQIETRFKIDTTGSNFHVTLGYLKKNTLRDVPALDHLKQIKLSYLRFYPDGSDEGLIIDLAGVTQ
jgi:hypothetical protein